MPTVISTSSYQKHEQIKLENIGKRQKRNNNENNKINLIKIVIRTNGGVYASGIILNNRLLAIPTFLIKNISIKYN